MESESDSSLVDDWRQAQDRVDVIHFGLCNGATMSFTMDDSD